jgi:tetratricopeptide (TPR) repeat protein
MHYLLMGDLERRPHLSAFVAELARRVPPAEAFRTAFGAEPAGLERELREYVRRLSFRYEFVTFRDQIVPEALGEGQPVEEADVEALLGELLLRVGRTEEAVARLDRSVAQFPASGAVLASRALADVYRSDYVVAAPRLAQAAALAPRDERVLFWNGVASYMVLATAGSEAIAEKERAAREAIDRALALRPDSPDLLAMLASLDGRGPDTQVRARDRWLRALQVAPTRADYALGLAAALIALGDHVAARNLLGTRTRRCRPSPAARAPRARRCWSRGARASNRAPTETSSP